MSLPVVTIPTSSDPFYEQLTQLDGVPYLLRFAWNHRAGVWSLSIADSNGNALVEGLALVTGEDLLRGHRHLSVPPGALFVAPAGTDDSPPGLEELGPGLRCELCYAPEVVA